MAEKVEITDSNPPEGGAQEARAPSEVHKEARPDWLPEKFKDAEQLAEAYKSLEAKMGEASQAEQAPEPEAEPAPQVEGLAVPTPEAEPVKEDQDAFLVKFENEFAEHGKLSDDSYAELAQHGLSRRHVDAYIAGIQATSQAEEARVYEAVGGQEAFATMATWAAENMQEGEVNRINEMFAAGGHDAVVAARALQAAYQGSGQAQPTLVEADGLSSTGATYESYKQLMTDMAAPEYQSDPAFRSKVEKKLMRTRQQGINL